MLAVLVILMGAATSVPVQEVAIVDRCEDSPKFGPICVLETAGGDLEIIEPRHLLPTDVKEGDVLYRTPKPWKRDKRATKLWQDHIHALQKGGK